MALRRIHKSDKICPKAGDQSQKQFELARHSCGKAELGWREKRYDY